MNRWFLEGQLSNKLFQSYLSEPSEELLETFQTVFKTANIKIINSFMGENGNIFFFLDGNSDELLSVIMMFRSLDVIYDIKVLPIIGFSKMNPVMYKAALVKEYYREPVAEIEKQKKILKEAKEQIKDSINYASRILQSMLPVIFPKDFEIGIHWQPLNIVGGDFYIIRDLGENVLIAVIDCSGHGIPGALLAALTNSIFDQAVINPKINEAGEYLAEAHKIFLQIFRNRKTKQVEGFDGTVCIYNREKQNLSVAGARNNLLFIEADGQVAEIKVNRKSVGNYRLEENFNFQTSCIDTKGRTFIMFTDGITDVMSSSKSILFGKERLMKELEKMNLASTSQIVSNIILSLNKYQGFEKNRDDQTLIVFRPVAENYKVI